MVKILRKAMMNKRNKQLTITIPKKDFKKLDPKFKFKEGTLFEVRPIKPQKTKLR